MANGWNLWVWLVSVVVRRYIYYRYPHNNYFFGSIIPISLFIFKCFFVLNIIKQIHKLKKYTNKTNTQIKRSYYLQLLTATVMCYCFHNQVTQEQCQAFL